MGPGVKFSLLNIQECHLVEVRMAGSMYKPINFTSCYILTETRGFGAMGTLGSGCFLPLVVVSQKARLLLCPCRSPFGSTVVC